MISSEHALVIIDMQEGLFRGPASPHSADAVLTNILLLIAKARQSQVPIFLFATSDPTAPLLCEQPVNQADSRAGCGR